MTIYVLENQPLMCHAIKLILHRIDPFKKVIEVHLYSKLQEAMLINGQPEAFLMEPLITGINGTAGIRKIKSNYPETPLIILSSILSQEAQTACLTAGADLYIEKTTPLREVLTLISNHLGGSQKSEVNDSKTQLAEKTIQLSKRQKQLVALVDAGLSNDEIAKRLEISAHTVKVHLWRFYKKLGVKSRTQLIKISRDNGYI
jgi:DNA-binding NarL/FixJ family response regulator